MKNCLLVDDSKVGLMEIQFTIKHFYPDCKFITTQDPHTGLALAKEHYKSLDLMVIDYNMSGMNGYDLASKVVEFFNPKKIVICSGNVQKIVKEKIEQLGLDFIEKRFNDEKFSRLDQRLKKLQLGS